MSAIAGRIMIFVSDLRRVSLGFAENAGANGTRCDGRTINTGMICTGAFYTAPVGSADCRIIICILLRWLGWHFVFVL